MGVTDDEHLALQLTLDVSALKKCTDLYLVSYFPVYTGRRNISRCVLMSAACPALYQIYDQFYNTTYTGGDDGAERT